MKSSSECEEQQNKERMNKIFSAWLLQCKNAEGCVYMLRWIIYYYLFFLIFNLLDVQMCMYIYELRLVVLTSSVYVP